MVAHWARHAAAAFPLCGTLRFWYEKSVSGNPSSQISNLIDRLAHFLVRSRWSYPAIGFGFPLFWVASLVCARYAPSFSLWLNQEDNWIENIQVVVLVIGLIMTVCLARKLRRDNLKLWAVLYACFALVIFFVAGEEISWGQRIFGFSTPQWFIQRNYQHEMNVHNFRSARPPVSFVRVGGPIILIALSAAYAALGRERTDKWRAYLYLPHPILIPLWTCYLSFSAIRPIYMATHPGKLRGPDVIAKLSEPAELIMYCGIVLFISMALTRELPVERTPERH